MRILKMTVFKRTVYIISEIEVGSDSDSMEIV